MIRTVLILSVLGAQANAAAKAGGPKEIAAGKVTTATAPAAQANAPSPVAAEEAMKSLDEKTSPATPATSAPSATCTAAGLTRSCDFFRDHAKDRRIELGDGTSFANPLSLASVPIAPAGGGLLGPDRAERQTKTLDAQARVLRAFESLPKDKKVSDTFKIAFENQMGDSAIARAVGETSKTSALIITIPASLPWPPGDESAKISKVEPADLAAYLQKLPAKVQSEIKSAVHDYRQLTLAATSPATSQPAKTEPVSAERLKRMNELAEFARNSIIEEIRAGRADSQLSPEEKAQIEKVRTLRVAASDSVATHPQCAQISPDAINNPINHMLALCPSFANYPDSQLVFLFGHEFSHSFDPCFRGYPLLRLDHAKIDAFAASESELPSEVKSDPDRLKIYRQLKSLPAKTDYSNYEQLLAIGNPAALSYFVDKGLVSVTAEAISADRDPTVSGAACLKKAGDFREVDAEGIRAFAAALADDVDEKSVNGADKSNLRASVEASLARHPQCAPTLAGGSQMTEVMADAWGAKALGRWLKEHPPKTEIEKIGSISTFAEDVCDAVQSVDSPGVVMKVSDLRDRMEHFSREPHPPARARLNSVILTEPRVQEALGCKSTAAPSCLALIGGASTSPASPTSPAVDSAKSGAVK